MPKTKTTKKAPTKLSAYQIFCKENRQRVIDQNPGLDPKQMIEVNKKLAEEWKSISPQFKAIYEKKAEEDKKRWQAEYEEWEKLYAQDEKKRRRKKRKDPNAPKKNRTAYMFFFTERSLALNKEHPEMKKSEIMKIIGREWGEVSGLEKEKYELQARQDKERYARDLEKYNKSKKSKQEESSGEESEESDVE